MWSCEPGTTAAILDTYQAVGPLYVQTLQTLLAAQCALVGDHLWPRDAIVDVLRDPNYDFIVVGAGSAGSVVANRLSEVPGWKVLLIEAGGNPTLATETPQVFYNNIDLKEDWGYHTQPQDRACRGYKTKGCAWPRGKLLGGSSSINAMFYVRGNKLDFDEWEASGNKGWSYEDVLPYFKKSEDFSEPITSKNEKYHRKGGYLSVELTDNVSPFEDLIIEAAKELGMKHLHDINSENQMGITRSFTTTKNYTRFSTARAFLNPIKNRKNLHVIKNAHATKILFKPNSNEVDGIMVHKNGQDIKINVKKEIIVSTGAINTPQLLMLSGIGPKDHLKELGIELIADLPVGESLQDHVFVPIYYSKPDTDNYVSLPTIVSALGNYVLNKRGPLADVSPHKIIGFTNTTDPTASSPDIQFHYVVLPPGITNMVDLYTKHGLNDDFNEKFNEINKNNIVLKVYHVLLKPKSTGRILLKSKNPFDYPLINANYFDEAEDFETVLRAIKQHALKLTHTTAFKEFGWKLQWVDIDACKNFDKTSEEYIKCWMQELTFSLYHPASTAKMGPINDKTTVVDPQLKVKNIKGLRVADTSVLPSIVRGNTNAVTIMIGEKASDMIKSDWVNSHTEL